MANKFIDALAPNFLGNRMKLKLIPLLFMGAVTSEMVLVRSIDGQGRTNIHERLTIRTARGTGVDEFYGGAICSESSIVAADARSNSVTLYDSLGKERWSRSAEGAPVSVACADNTVLVLERSDDWQLVIVNLVTGIETGRVPMILKRAETARILGKNANAWAILIESQYTDSGEPRALQFPMRTLRRFEPETKSFKDVFIRIDSSSPLAPTINQKPSRYAVRSPFGGRSYIVAMRSGSFLYSSGFGFTLDALEQSGRPIRKIATPGTWRPLSRDSLSQLVKSWNWYRTASMPDSLITRLLMSEATLKGFSLGQMVVEPNGQILVHRRDLDQNPIINSGPHHYDWLDWSGKYLGQVMFEERVTPISFSGHNVLAIRSVSSSNASSGPKRFDELVVYSVDRPL